MSKYVIDINEMEECNSNLKRAKSIIYNTTLKGTVLFTALGASWEGAAADAFAARFMAHNKKIQSSADVIGTLIDKNNEVKNAFIQTDNDTKHLEVLWKQDYNFMGK